MIINENRKPCYSLYYIGAIILHNIGDGKSAEELYVIAQSTIDNLLSIDYVYYAIDWLFLLGAVKNKDGIICYDN